MNIKHLIQQSPYTGLDTAIVNHGALGNAWLVRSTRVCDNPNDEIQALGNVFELDNK